ncbi:polysaccharide pyruvyl transferase family protein [Proteus sp. ZN5]|uniref:polysaccharide pyruvyl transferase family protein n=1 Tax=Proteus sp. ZN5 TaxID=2697019 RepID=UPI0013E15F16|nr:polysaccharide pyruvyl transferase family protein [Proteus sp. ZN5]QIG04161.1 polysaccharide pyruvyl transferase family protein [Proteus sp. ZN5]
MKIGILTQPLVTNYGGLLQAYALQEYLRKNNFEALTVNIQPKKPKLWGIKGIVLNVIKKYIFRKNFVTIFPQSRKEKKSIRKNTYKFIKNNIKTTVKIESIKKIDILKQYNFNAYIVGSDQVWRPTYSPNIKTYFLDFLKDDTKTIRIAYAASFGLDHCNEFTQKELNTCSELAKKFHLISVREDSAVELCKKHFKVNAQHVLDPTMLLDKKDYIKLIEEDNTFKNPGNMMTYILDKSSDKQKIIDIVANKYNLTPYTVMPTYIDKVFPPVTQWLRGFMEAEYVVTDSFHGVVFSIIFNKPFIAIGNIERGLARFSSILKKFNLEDRIIFSSKDLTSDFLNRNIDYNVINNILLKEKAIASSILLKTLHSK